MKQPPNQFTHYNRPGNPLTQLGWHQHQHQQQQPQQQQQQGTINLGFSHPHPFGQQPILAEESWNPPRIDPVTDYSASTSNQLAGVYGHHWDFDQHAHDTSSPSKALGFEHAGESSRVPMSDLPANQPDSAFNFDFFPHSDYFETQLNASLPNANQGGATLPGNFPHASQFYDFSNAKTKSNPAPRQSDFSRPTELSVDQPKKKSCFEGERAQPWDVGNEATRPVQGNAPGPSSQVHRDEKPSCKRLKRKITERRREQNRVHQKAFRERRDHSSHQKEVELRELEERLNQYEVAGKEQRKTVRDLQAQLDPTHENLQSNQNCAFLADYSRGHHDGNSLHLDNQSLPSTSEIFPVQGNLSAPTMPNADQQHQSGSFPLPWNFLISPSNQQSLPSLENLEIREHRHLAPLIMPSSNPPASGSSSLQLNPSDSSYPPGRSLGNSNLSEGSRQSYPPHYHHRNPSQR